MEYLRLNTENEQVMTKVEMFQEQLKLAKAIEIVEIAFRDKTVRFTSISGDDIDLFDYEDDKDFSDRYKITFDESVPKEWKKIMRARNYVTKIEDLNGNNVWELRQAIRKEVRG
tara:strand:+ start:287 stop:628 length:342 start_codon:yes stop_codon:yes gene_type:complete